MSEARPQVVSEPKKEALSGHSYPTEGDFAFREVATELAFTEVERIKEEAMALGWTEPFLLQTKGTSKFPSGPEYGLICFLKGGRKITQVKESCIVMEAPSGTVLRFYRPDRIGNPGITIRGK